MLHTVSVEKLDPGHSSSPHVVFATELSDIARKEADRLAGPGVRVTRDPCSCVCGCNH